MDAGEKEQTPWYERRVQTHAPEVLGWLQRRFPEVKDPENLVQEALLRVWRKLSHEPEEGSPRAFLFVTARNLALDELRRNKIISMDSITEIEGLLVSMNETTAADDAAAKQELELLKLAIQSLPERCRQVFNLRKIHGLSQKEIAAKMGIAEHTVEVQIANGMRRCAEFLRKYDLP